jgi:bacillithiol biosynthesis cysteine-adding enzyme BshC
MIGELEAGLMVEVVPLDYRKLWYRPLFLDYLHRFRALSPFFFGDPFLPESWRLVARELESREHPREAVGRALERLNRDLGADDRALKSLEALREGALAVVTGQQVGLFGGPLYTLYKALTAVRLARWASATLDRNVVPLFWMDADDHDFDEVRQFSLLSSSNELVDLRYESHDSARRLPVGARRLEPAIEAVLSASSSALPPSEFREEILEILSRCYAAGRTLAEAFGSFLLHATRNTGLAVIDPAVRELKGLGGELFTREVREGGASSASVRSATERLLALGYHAQASTTDSHLNLFYARPERHALVKEGSGIRLSSDGKTLSREDVERRIRDEPECFSPNVILRPLYQDTLLPTLAYVAGPNELAYFAQLKDVYSHFGVTMPLIATRNSFTVVERREARFLERYGLDWTRFQSDDESLLNEILHQHTPPQLEEDLTRARSCIQDITQAIARDLASVDPTLVTTAESTRGKLLHHLGELESKALRAVKRKNETVRNQFLATRTALFPGFDLQERRLSPLVFLGKHGWHFARMIEEGCDPAAKAHLVLYT